MATEYKNIPSYTLKARLYPSKTAQETMSNYIVGLEKTANMTLWALQQHEPLIVDAKEDVNKETGEITTVYWPNFHRMAKAEWLNKLRSQNPAIKDIPASSLSSSVGGLFLCDLKKMWEAQGKYPVDLWFSKKDAKGHHVIRYYKNKKRRHGFYVQIPAKNIVNEEGRIYVTIPKIGKMRIRGWNDSIKFGTNADQSYFDYYSTSDSRLGMRITVDSCDNWYVSVTLANVSRPFKCEEKQDIGIDVNLASDTGVTLSNGDTYPNNKYKTAEKQRLAELNRRISRRYGYGNIQFRNDCATAHRADATATIVSSKRYAVAKMQKARLESKVQRRRNDWQHKIASNIVSRAKFIGIESLNVKGMLKNSNLSEALSDAAFSSQLEKIHYKAEWNNVPVQQIGMFEPSSHICPNCGYKMEGDEKFGLATREWTCPNCGTHHIRDIAAAQNILNIAKSYYFDDVHLLDGTVKETKPNKNKTKPKDKPISKNHPEIIIHFDETMYDAHKNPWVVIKDERVIDDAQGYGYKTAQAAQKAFKFKYPHILL